MEFGGSDGLGFLVHGWDRIKHVHFHSLLGLSTHKSVKCYPTMVKVSSLRLIGVKGFSCPAGFWRFGDSGLGCMHSYFEMHP